MAGNSSQNDRAADTKEANESLGDMRGKVKKLKNLRESGQYDQGGYLSDKQVNLYRRLVREIEGIYSTHYEKLGKLEEKYQNDIKNKYGKNLQELQKEVEKRQRLYDNANGGNRHGDVANQKVLKYHENKLKEAQEQLNSANDMDKELNSLREIVKRLEQQRNSSSSERDQIDNLRVRNTSAQHSLNRMGLGVMYGMGLGHGIHAYMDYMNPDLLRRQESLSNGVSQKLSEYNGVQAHDADYRERMQVVAESNNYGLLEAGQTANVLASGGVHKGKNQLRDLGQVERFSRAYGTDANEMSQDFASLRKMGTLGEGEMNRFANLIGGAVAKNGMRGREAEMLQSTMTLVQSVARGLPSLSEKGMSNVVGMQTALGDAIPEYKGERGAQLLSNWDSAIKGGDQGFDLLMGRGTNPQFTGLSGTYKLNKLKEEGLSNPETAKLFFQGLDRMFDGSQNAEEMKGFAFQQQGFGSLHDYEALRDSGFIDKIKSGKMPTGDSLRKAGLKDLAKQYDKYNNSETKRVDYLKSRKENQQADHQKLSDEMSKQFNEMWFKIPEEIRHPLITAGFLGGGGLALKGIRALGTHLISPRVGGGGSILSALRTAGSVGLKYGGRLLGGAGLIYGAESLSSGAADWVFGHPKGGQKSSAGPLHSLMDKITGKKEGVYKDERKWVGARFWDWLTGDDDQQALPTKNKKKKTTTNTADSGKETEYALAQSLSSIDKDHKLTITIDGSVDGMDKKNQDKVADSVSTYFNTALNNYNLAFDQRRG
jgi:hypothetical protein